MHTRYWTWMVLVASGALVWACGGDDDSGSTGGDTSTGGSAGSGGTGGSAGSGGTGGGASSGGSGPSTSGGPGSSTTGTTGNGTGGTTSTGTTSAGSGGGAGDAGAAGMAGAGGDGEAGLEELCEADCAKLLQVGCEIPDANTCVQDFCLAYVNSACEAEYRAYLECEAAADVGDFVCFEDGFPSVPSGCTDLFEAATTYCEG